MADAAGVSVETVYKTFGGKPGLVKALWDVTLAGDDEPVPMGERAELRAVWATPRLDEKLRGYAAFVRGVHERLAPLLAVLTSAGADAAEVLAISERERMAGVSAFVAHLAGPADIVPEAVTDAFWALTGPHLFIQLIRDRGWSPAAYERWLAAMLAATVEDSRRA